MVVEGAAARKLSHVLDRLDEAKNTINVVILDACRDNPFARSFRSASRGLAKVDASSGTLIAYATAPGRTAADGDGANGIYTEETLRVLRTPIQGRRGAEARPGRRRAAHERRADALGRLRQSASSFSSRVLVAARSS